METFSKWHNPEKWQKTNQQKTKKQKPTSVLGKLWVCGQDQRPSSGGREVLIYSQDRPPRMKEASRQRYSSIFVSHCSTHVLLTDFSCSYRRRCTSCQKWLKNINTYCVEHQRERLGERKGRHQPVNFKCLIPIRTERKEWKAGFVLPKACGSSRRQTHV